MIDFRRHSPAGIARILLRAAIPLCMIMLCASYMSDDWATLDGAAVIGALCGIEPLTWVAAMLAVVISFFAVAGQERAVMAHLGHAIDRRRGLTAAMATAAVSQTVGFGPLVGTVVRKRMLPELSVTQAAQVSLLITLGFFVGLGLLLLFLQAIAVGGLVGLVLVLVVSRLALRFEPQLPPTLRDRLPDGWTSFCFLSWVMIDIGALGLAAWLVLPESLRAELLFADFFPHFLGAFGAGLASGSPAGTGPLEAILLDGMAQGSTNDLAAGIIAFRLSAYALPAGIGALVAALSPVLLRQRDKAICGSATLVPIQPDPQILGRLHRAELHLALQGELRLLRDGNAAVWLEGRVGCSNVHVGDPAPFPESKEASSIALDRALDGACERASRLGRSPSLYRIGPRLAARARARGWSIQRIAREAILAPASFSTEGSARSGLRRKLRQAEQAGVRVARAVTLPLDEMSEVAAAWSSSHGGERGFSMGRFVQGTLRHQIVMLAHGRDGRLVAFVTFHASEGEWVLDLIRCRPECPDGTLYLAVVAAIRHARQAGISRLSLASVPEPGWGVHGLLGPIARHLTSRAQGLAQFKQAFRPTWEPRYIAAQSPIMMVCAAIGIAYAVHWRKMPASGPKRISNFHEPCQDDVWVSGEEMEAAQCETAQ